MRQMFPNIGFALKMPEIIGLFLLLLMGLAVRIVFVSNELEWLVGNTPDDAFYYLEIATNIVDGKGSTFDGRNLTNGYHPLWMLLILPFAAIFDQPQSLLRAVLSLGILLDALTALVIYGLLRKVAEISLLPILGTALYYFAPITARYSLNALETVVVELVFALALLVVFNLTHPDAQPTTRSYLLVGLLLALLFLARTDNAFYVIVYGAVTFFAGRMPLGQRMFRSAVAAGSALLLVAPWMLWSQANFGSIVQHSGYATTWVVRNNQAIGSERVLSLWRLPSGAISYVAVIGAIFLLGSFALFLLFKRFSQPPLRTLGNLLIPLLAAACLMQIINSLVRGVVRPWYFGSHVVLITVFGVVLLIITIHRFSWKGFSSKLRIQAEAVLIASVVIALFVVLQPFRILALDRFPHQRETLEGAYWLRENTTPEQRSAAFNAGVIGFFSERSVSNLDGLVNYSAFRALQRGELGAYLLQDDIIYLIDYHPEMLVDQYSERLGESAVVDDWTVVHEFPRSEGGWADSILTVFKLE